MVSDQEIAESLDYLLRRIPPTHAPTLSGIIQDLQTKLGLDLSHKIDFIHSRIGVYVNSVQPLKPVYAHPQNPNFQSNSPQPSSNFALHRAEPAPSSGTLIRSDQAALDVSVPPPSAAGRRPAAGVKRRGGPGGLNKLCDVSPELQAIVGKPRLPRTEIVKQLWAYIRSNNLQDPTNKRKIICNEELRLVFETDSTDMFKMNKLLAKHIISLEPSKAGQQLLRAREDEEQRNAARVEQHIPTLLISEALANFFGSSEREMLQTEVLQRVWEYIKINHLEDPMNQTLVLCDAKLQELLGCESISAMGIHEMLARRHLFKRS